MSDADRDDGPRPPQGLLFYTYHMPLTLAVFLACVAQGSAQSLPPEALKAQADVTFVALPGLAELRSGSLGSAPPQVTPKPVCERKPEVARVALPEPRAYWRSNLGFTMDGRRVRVSASKDRRQKFGYFVAFLAEGESEPVWVKAKLSAVPFLLLGRRHFLDVDLDLLHHERIKLIVTRDGDPSFRAEFTTGELAKAVQETGPAFAMQGRQWRVTYVEDIEERDKKVVVLPDRHSLVLTTYDSYVYDGGKTGYNFQKHTFEAEAMSGPRVWPRYMGAEVRFGSRKAYLTYGFHVTAQRELVVYDWTDYDPSAPPACPPDS